MQTPITCDDVVQFIFRIAPDPTAYHETENVYAFGDPRTICRGVAVAWWPGPETMRQAAAAGLNLIISHEDPIMVLPKPPLRANRMQIPDTFSVRANRERIRVMTEHNLVVHRHHWNIDCAPWGIIGAFIEQIGWQSQVVHHENITWIVELPPVPLAELAARIKERLDVPFLRVASPKTDHIARRIGVAPGGYGQSTAYVAAFHSLGCDTVVLGDMIHACSKMATECGMAVIDCLHHAAEEPGLRVLTAKIAGQFSSLPVRFFTEAMPWHIC